MMEDPNMAQTPKNSLHTRRCIRAVYLDTAMRLLMDASMIDCEDSEETQSIFDEIYDKLEKLTEKDVRWINVKDGRWKR